MPNLPNGFRFLTNTFWTMFMAAKKLKEMPAEVKELIEHLRSTGTGEGKLQKISAISLQVNLPEDAKEFMLALKTELPEGTYEKVEEFIRQKQAEHAATVVTPEEFEEVNTPPIQEEETPIKNDSGIPTQDMNAAEAIKAIHNNNYNKDQLEIIAGFDTRKSVQEAAAKKLES